MGGGGRLPRRQGPPIPRLMPSRNHRKAKAKPHELEPPVSVADTPTSGSSCPWYTFEHKACSTENIPNANSFGLEHFLLEH